jgi:hypothetical protein
VLHAASGSRTRDDRPPRRDRPAGDRPRGDRPRGDRPPRRDFNNNNGAPRRDNREGGNR